MLVVLNIISTTQLDCSAAAAEDDDDGDDNDDDDNDEDDDDDDDMVMTWMLCRLLDSRSDGRHVPVHVCTLLQQKHIKRKV